MRHWSIRPGRRHRAGRTRSQAPAGRLIRRELSSPVWCHVTGETHERIGRAARLASIPSYPDVRDRRNPLHSSSGKKNHVPGNSPRRPRGFRRGVAARSSHARSRANRRRTRGDADGATGFVSSTPQQPQLSHGDVVIDHEAPRGPRVPGNHMRRLAQFCQT